MCVVSMIGDNFKDRWEPHFPKDWGAAPVIPKGIPPIYPPAQPLPPAPNWPQPAPVAWKDFNDLKKEVEILKELLIRAKKYDEDNGEPDCEMDDKIAFLKRVAEWVGVDLNDVLGK